MRILFKISFYALKSFRGVCNAALHPFEDGKLSLQLGGNSFEFFSLRQLHLGKIILGGFNFRWRTAGLHVHHFLLGGFDLIFPLGGDFAEPFQEFCVENLVGLLHGNGAHIGYESVDGGDNFGAGPGDCGSWFGRGGGDGHAFDGAGQIEFQRRETNQVLVR